ncbi:hypothetical protein [Streptomyces sp. CA-106131]|uniref:hypothetical protein n=1 Tax=Streptomyces sp. CA-106131 TaxID=3240045 RepID=UPI003D8B45E4
MFDQDGNPLPAPENANLSLLIRTLRLLSSLADEVDREPHSFTVHGDVLLAQISRVADVAQWVGLAATSLRRGLLEDRGLVPAAGEPAGTAGAGLTRYWVVAQRTDPAHPGAAVLTNYTYARSIEEAVAKVRRAKGKPGGLYGDQGLYRVVEAVEDSPESQARQLQDARGRFLTAALGNHEPTAAHPELLGILCDFFTRTIVSPNSEADDNAQLHTRDGQALSRLLLAYLDHHGLDLAHAPQPAAGPDERWGVDPSIENYTADTRLAERDEEKNQAEDSPASPELIEQVLDICEQHYAAVTGTSSEQWDKDLSWEPVGIALQTVRLAERETYPQALEEYLRENQARLERMWRRYGPDGFYPRGFYRLVELPESSVLCERIDTARLWLKAVWAEERHKETSLERLEEAWLYDTSEKEGR